jgi:hypothetical protein
MGMAIYRWCADCARDLKEFAEMEVPKGKLIDPSDESAVSRYRVEMVAREGNFMRQKVNSRRSH